MCQNCRESMSVGCGADRCQKQSQKDRTRGTVVLPVRGRLPQLLLLQETRVVDHGKLCWTAGSSFSDAQRFLQFIDAAKGFD